VAGHHAGSLAREKRGGQGRSEPGY
jgi:hypothetical protein